MPVQVRTRLEAELDEARAALEAATDHEEIARRARNQASARLENARSAELRVELAHRGARPARSRRTNRRPHASMSSSARRSQRRAAAVPAPAAAVSHAAPEVDITEVDVDELEVYLLARLVAQRSVGRGGQPARRDRRRVRGAAGRDDREGDRGRSSASPPAFQFIYLSDDPEIEAWARLFGPKGASVRRFSSAQSVPGDLTYDRRHSPAPEVTWLRSPKMSSATWRASTARVRRSRRVTSTSMAADYVRPAGL